ncbi:hypothetical protein [Streptomyces sp. NPDC048357]|uniref:hypothetical protein n=1 Tax=Streptomyces sp. NPDC048357 TaxID=3154719 RepID=UPI0034316658
MMVLSGSFDMVEEAVQGERNVLDTVCAAERRRMAGWALERLREPWTPCARDVRSLWSGYVGLGQRHRFALRGLSAADRRSITALWPLRRTWPL